MSVRETAGVLICGLPRSGTTLMRALLGSHPSFAVPTIEMNYWVRLYPEHRRRASWAEFVRALLDDELTRELGGDRAVLEQAIAAHVEPGRHAEAFALVLADFARRRGRPRWGEKTPLAEHYAPHMLEALPATKVVHIVRDPRDMAASYRKLAWPSPTRWTGRATRRLRASLAWLMGNWRSSVRLAEQGPARYPDRYLVLRYEDIVAEPERTMRHCCQFLGEPFHPGMLRQGAIAELTAHGGNSSFGRLDGVSRQPVGRFLRVLAPRDIALCERLAGPRLTRHGYQLSATALPAIDRIRHAVVDVPGAAAIGALQTSLLRASGLPRA